MNRIISKVFPAVPVLPKKKRVAAYARVSSGKDAMLQSLSAQVSYYSVLIQRHSDWEYAGVYADEALTGTKDSRDDFQKLLTECRAGNVDLILTKSISRFARNTLTLLESVRELKKHGVDVYFERENIHSQSCDGELMLTILASYAQEESLSASENQKWHVRKNYAEGKLSNYLCIYGYYYNNGQLTVIPEEAAVVRMIFADYLSGMGRWSIANKLIHMGIPTKNKGRWSAANIASILANEKYTGDMLLQKGFVTDHLSKRRKENHGELPQYYVEGSHDAIIDRETFDAVQKEISRRADISNHPRTRTLCEFSGLIHCQRCGANFRKINCASGTKYEKAAWACDTLVSRGKACCASKRIPEDILKEKCAEVLGLSEYDPDVLKAKISNINVPDDGILVFILKDGSQVSIPWQNRSRCESWTAEMREVARQRAIGGNSNA